MNTIKGPAIFLAQFFDSKAPFNDLQSICKWAKDAEFNPTSKQGVNSGYQSWVNRVGRFDLLEMDKLILKVCFQNFRYIIIKVG